MLKILLSTPAMVASQVILWVLVITVLIVKPSWADVVPTPKSITLVCDKNIQQGTVVLSDPPKFSCKDYEQIKSVIGLGITVGPDTRVLEISRAIKRANRQIKSANAVPVFQAPKSPVKVRLGDWKETKRTANLQVEESNLRPKNVSWQEVRQAHLEEEWRRNNLQLDDSSQWINIGSFEDEYKRFDGFSRNRKFFRQWK